MSSISLKSFRGVQVAQGCKSTIYVRTIFLMALPNPTSTFKTPGSFFLTKHVKSYQHTFDTV